MMMIMMVDLLHKYTNPTLASSLYNYLPLSHLHSLLSPPLLPPSISTSPSHPLIPLPSCISSSPSSPPLLTLLPLSPFVPTLSSPSHTLPSSISSSPSLSSPSHLIPLPSS